MYDLVQNLKPMPLKW